MAPRQARVRVLVADDHPTTERDSCGAIKACPDLELIGEADDGREALEEIPPVRPRRHRARPEHAGHDRLRDPRGAASETGSRNSTSSSSPRRAIPRRSSRRSPGRGRLPPEGGRPLQGLRRDRRRRARRGRPLARRSRPSWPSEILPPSRPPGQGAPRSPPREREVLDAHRAGPLGAGDRLPAPRQRGDREDAHEESRYEKLGVSDRAAAVAEAMRQGHPRVTLGPRPCDRVPGAGFEPAKLRRAAAFKTAGFASLPTRARPL